MRLVSLLPAITEIICEIGLGDELVAVSSDSDWPPGIKGLPVVTSASPSSATGDAFEPDRRLIAQTHGAAPGQQIELAALLDQQPDLVLTQDRCRGCGAEIRPLRLPPGEELPFGVVSLEPVSVEGIFNAITTVGAMTEAEDDAIALVEALRSRLGNVEQLVERRRDAGRPPSRVVALQRLDPPATAGHWIPEQIRRAGGWELLGTEGGPSVATTWDAIREVDPEVLLVMPADFPIPLAMARWERTSRPAPWQELPAVQAGRAFLLDGPAYFARPGPRVIDGIELLAEVFDLDTFVDLAPPGSWAPLPPA